MRLSMKHHILIALASLLAVPLACWGQEINPVGMSPKILPSIVVLHIQRPDGIPVTATAFAGVKDGVLVTALHIIKDAVRVTATFPNGEEFDCAGIIDKDERRNLALVRVKAFGRPMLKINPSELAVGEKFSLPIIKEGAFGVVETSVAEALIIGGIKFYRLTGEFPGGNSGSPIIDSRGEVAGVHVTITQDNKTTEMALPAAYILGLEPSLPVQPWTQTASQQPAASPAPGPNATVDASLAATLIKVHDNWSYFTNLSERIYRITRYGSLGGLDLYKIQADLDNDISQLGWLKTEDPLRQKLIQATAQLITKEKQALEYNINCANLNKNTPPSKAMPQAEEFAKRAAALLNSIPGQVQPLQPGFRQLAQNSPEFLKALPIEMRYFLGVIDRKSKLTLGAYTSANNPFYILDLMKNQLGDELGLSPGDTIISAGDRTFKAEDDIEDFKLILEGNPGKVLEVVVKRGSKIKTLSMKIPLDVLQKYGRTS
jgi:S1-C subfamily serine protease